MEKRIRKITGERVIKDGDRVHDDHMLAILMTLAGTAVLMAAYVKRALMLFLVEQWRNWVFLLLNLLLLAIFFTSGLRTQESQERENENSKVINNNNNKKKKQDIQRRQESRFPLEVEEDNNGFYRICRGSTISSNNVIVGVNHDEKEKVEEEDEDKEANCGLSKEELNERVEAFIVMFKQHLVSDARNAGIKFNFS